MISDLETPALLLDPERLARNVERMNGRMLALGVALRPHLKTAKSVEVARVATEGWSRAVTVSTLKEAEQSFAAGYSDILYAVGIAPGKLPHVARLVRAGAALTLILDSVEAAKAVAAFGEAEGLRLPVLIEIDADNHRAGVRPDEERLIAIGRILDRSPGTELRGVMTHAGGSYDHPGAEALAAHAELERSRTVEAAERLRAAGLPCPVVSVGSTPTALFARDLTGVTEVRAGVYMFMDLVMAGLGVCAVDDIAISVLTSVIGHQPQRNQLIVDAGWMAMSRDMGRGDQGYGLVCDAAGRLIPDLIVASANQEHGLVADRQGRPLDPACFPLGTLLRILPNHACATAAQFDRYHLPDGAIWPRFSGW